MCLFYMVRAIFIFGVDQYSENKKCVTKIEILPYFCRGVDVDRKAFAWVLQGANFVSGLESGSKHFKCTGKWVYALGDDGKVQDFITDKPKKYVIRLHIPIVSPLLKMGRGVGGVPFEHIHDSYAPVFKI